MVLNPAGLPVPGIAQLFDPVPAACRPAMVKKIKIMCLLQRFFRLKSIYNGGIGTYVIQVLSAGGLRCVRDEA